ncbi:hypothetical protein NLI96_g12426 [Meripilus lineatus]|uniref:Uncharacterized protein n=1 Tax=Meripilus lineatus TaxID=2056292 RepID=A0AAD5Y9W7_9APHY|nr:hypothetical protein NLI96_g12426 [Physisporinus lineatus]
MYSPAPILQAPQCAVETSHSPDSGRTLNAKHNTAGPRQARKMRTGKAPREPKTRSNRCDSEKPIDFRFMDGIRSHYQKFKDFLSHEPEYIPETQLPMVALETYSHTLQIQEYASNSRDWKISDLDDSDGTPIFECAWAECKVKLKLGPGSKRAYSDHIFQAHGIIVSGGVIKLAYETILTRNIAKSEEGFSRFAPHSYPTKVTGAEAMRQGREEELIRWFHGFSNYGGDSYYSVLLSVPWTPL